MIEPPVASTRLTVLDVGLVLVRVIWGVNFVVIKAALETMPPFLFNALRYSTGTAMLGLIFKLNGTALGLPRREWWLMAVLGFLGALYQIFFTQGLEHTTVANNALIVTTVPVWVLILNVRRRQERLSRVATIGIFLALLGVTIVVLGRYAGQFGLGTQTLLGDFLSLLASWTWAVSILASRRPLQRNSTPSATFWILLWTTVFQIALAGPDLLRLDRSWFQPNIWLSLCFSGIGSIALGNLIWNGGVKKLGTARTSVYAYLEPVVAAIAAIVFLGEPFSAWLVLGASLVLFGLVLVKKG